MIKLSDEGVPKATIGWNLNLLGQVVNVKDKFLKEIKSATPVLLHILLQWKCEWQESKTHLLLIWRV